MKNTKLEVILSLQYVIAISEKTQVENIEKNWLTKIEHKKIGYWNVSIRHLSYKMPLKMQYFLKKGTLNVNTFSIIHHNKQEYCST